MPSTKKHKAKPLLDGLASEADELQKLAADMRARLRSLEFEETIFQQVLDRLLERERLQERQGGGGGTAAPGAG